MSRNFADQRVSFQTMFHNTQPVNGFYTSAFGNGNMASSTRLTFDPIYEDEGRHLMHLGLSGGWRDGTNNIGAVTSANDTIRLRARPEMRDDDPADLVHDEFAAALFGDAPLGRSILGTIDSISALTRRQVAGYYRRRYRPEGIVVSAAGNVDHAAVVRQVRRAFAPRPRR